MAAVADSIEGNKADKQEPTIEKRAGNEELLTRLIEGKDARIRALESEVAFRRRRVEERTPLALRRRRSSLRWFRPLSVHAGADLSQ